MAILSLAATPASAFFSNGRWASTATNSSTGPAGSAATVTWSIVPNGTNVPGYATSNLVSFLDGLYRNSGADLAARPWFPLVKQSFDRWSALGGLTFAYEPNDDGVTLGNFSGSLMHRGDVRLAGTNIDGNGGAYGQSGFIPSADITLDTADSGHFASSPPTNLGIRNTLMHEIGHALGLAHLDSTSNFLMEGFYDPSYDGPQLDDIRGLHQLYGDFNEKSNNGAGNNTLANATALGAIAAGQSLTLGADGATGTAVLPTETSFLSITNHNDVDYFAISIDAPLSLDLTLTPVGATYNQRSGTSGMFTSVVASQASDLGVELYSSVGGSPMLLASSVSQPLGQAESILGFQLTQPGDYFIKVNGTTDVVQLYQLAVGVQASAPPLAGDFDLDNDVDGADFLAWQQGFGPTYDGSDLADWQAEFGTIVSSAATATAVPEPHADWLVASFLLGLAVLARQR